MNNNNSLACPHLSVYPLHTKIYRQQEKVYYFNFTPAMPGTLPIVYDETRRRRCSSHPFPSLWQRLSRDATSVLLSGGILFQHFGTGKMGYLAGWNATYSYGIGSFQNHNLKFIYNLSTNRSMNLENLLASRPKDADFLYPRSWWTSIFS